MRPTIALLALAACTYEEAIDDTGSVDVDSGDLALCLGTDDPVASKAGWASSTEVSGAVVDPAGLGDYNLSESWLCGSAETVLAVEDSAGSTWWLGLEVTDSQGTVAIPVALSIGAQVDLVVRQSDNESGSYPGAVVRDADGSLLFAAENLGLHTDDLPEVEVGAGEGLLIESNDCGTREWQETTFAADDTLTLVPGEEGALQVAGEAFTVRSVDSFDWTEVQCTDLGAERAWVMWR